MSLIKLPDGKIAEFPDSMPTEEIESVLNSYYAPPPGVEVEKPTNFEKSIGWIQQRVYQGLPLKPQPWTDTQLPPMERMAHLISSTRQKAGPPKVDKLKYWGSRLPLGAALDYQWNKEKLAAADRFVAGEPTNEDLVVLRDAYDEMLANKDRGWVQKGLDVAGYMPGFAVEVGLLHKLTGGASTALRVGSIAQKLSTTSRGMKALVGAGKVVGTAALGTATVGVPRVMAGATSRQLYDTESAAKSYVKSVGDVFIEYASEMSGAAIGQSAASAKFREATRKAYTQVTGKTAKDFSRQMSIVGFDGIVAELLEELAGDAARGLTGVEDDYGPVLSAESWEEAAKALGTMTIAFAFPSGFRAAAGAAGFGDDVDVAGLAEIAEKANPGINRPDVTPVDILSSRPGIREDLLEDLKKYGDDPKNYPRKRFATITGVKSTMFGRNYRQLITETLDAALESDVSEAEAENLPEDADSFDFGSQFKGDPTATWTPEDWAELEERAKEIKEVHDNEARVDINDSLNQIAGQFGYKNASGLRLALQNHFRDRGKEDVKDIDSFDRYDEIIRMAENTYGNLLGKSENVEEAVIESILTGYAGQMPLSEARNIAKQHMINTLERERHRKAVRPDYEEEFGNVQFDKSVSGDPPKFSDPGASEYLGKKAAPKVSPGIGQPTPPMAQGVPVNVRMPMKLKAPKELVKIHSAPEIIKQAEKTARAFGSRAKIRVGFMSRMKAAGAYYPWSDSIFLATADNIATALHELGHAIDARNFVKGKIEGKAADTGWRGIVDPVVATEMETLGRDRYGKEVPAAGYLKEGFAEFIYLYVADRAEIPKRARNLAEWFESQMNDAQKAAIEETRRMVEVWKNAGSFRRAMASIARPKRLIEKILNTPRSKIKQVVIEQIFDTLEPLRLMAMAAETELGEALKKEMDPYRIGKTRRGAAPAIVNYMVKHAMLDINGNPVGPSLNEIKALIGEENYDEFMAYTWALQTFADSGTPIKLINETEEEHQRRLEIAEKRRPTQTGLSLQDAEQIFNELDSPNFQLAASKVRDWNLGLLNYMAQSSPGMADSVNVVIESDPGYFIPLPRATDDYGPKYRGSGPSAPAGTISARKKGSGLRLKDPFERLIINAQIMVETAHHAQVIEAVRRLAEDVPGMGNFLQRVPRDMELKWAESADKVIQKIKSSLKKRQLGLMITDDEGNPYESPRAPDGTEIDDPRLTEAMKDAIRFYGMKARYTGGHPVMAIKTEGGDIKWYYMDPHLFDALNSKVEGLFNPHSHAAAIMMGKALNRHNQLFKLGTVGIRPAFMIANTIRDFATFMVQTQSDRTSAENALVWLGVQMEVIGHHAFLGLESKGKIGQKIAKAGEKIGLLGKSEWVDVYMRTGVAMAERFAENVDATKDLAQEVFGKSGKKIHFLGKAGNLAGNAIDLMSLMSQMTESTSRIAEQKLVAKKIGWNPSMPITAGIHSELALAPKEVTTDFTAMGYLGGMLNMLIPFLNANLQGPRAMLRAYNRDPKTFMQRASMLVALTLFQWWRNKDEEWYKEADNRKFLFYCFEFTNPTNGQSELIMLPRDYGAGVLFGGITEGLVDSLYRWDPESAKKAVGTFLSVARPSMAPPAAKTALEQMMNYQFFSGRQIVPPGLEDVPEYQQYTQFTTRAAKFLGRQLYFKAGLSDAASPARLEHAVNSLFGPVWMDTVRSAENMIFGAADKTSGINMPNVPVTGRLFKKGGPMGYRPESMQKVYDIAQELRRKSNDRENPETPEQRHMRLLMQDAANAITDLSAIRNMVDNEDDRRAATAEALEIAKEALRQYEGENAPLRGKVHASKVIQERRRKAIERERGQ